MGGHNIHGNLTTLPSTNAVFSCILQVWTESGKKTLRLSPHDTQPAREWLAHDGQPVYKDFQPPRPSKIQIPNGIVIPSPSSLVPFQAPDSIHLKKIVVETYVMYHM